MTSRVVVYQSPSPSGFVIINNTNKVTVLSDERTQIIVRNFTVLSDGAGGGGSVDSVNSQTGVVILDADDISDASTSNKFMTSAEKTKLAGIESGAEVNTVNSVAGKTGSVILVKGDVGLGNVDNTSDLSKPISTATQTALDGKQPLSTILTNTTASFTTLQETKLAGIEAGADVTDATNVNAAGAVMESDYSPSHSILVQQSGTGSPTALQVGNNTLIGRMSGGGSQIDDLSPTDVRTLLSISNVDNTSDLNKPISTATQTALDGKANTSHTHTASQVTDFSEAVDDRVASLLVAGTNITLSYNDVANTLTIAASDGGGGSVVSGSATIDFGAYGYATKVSVADTLVTATSKILVSLASPASGRDDDELEFNPICVAAIAKAGVGFDIYATAPIGADGQFNVNYVIGEY